MFIIRCLFVALLVALATANYCPCDNGAPGTLNMWGPCPRGSFPCMDEPPPGGECCLKF